MNLVFRFLSGTDLIERCAALDARCFPEPWSVKDFRRVLSDDACYGTIAEHNGRRGVMLAGFVVIMQSRLYTYLLDLAVAPEYRRLKVGTRLVNVAANRPRIVARVRDDNLEAHLFFKALGFRAMSVERGFYDGGVDAYKFVCRREKLCCV